MANENFKLNTDGWKQEVAISQGLRENSFNQWTFVPSASGCPKCGAQLYSIVSKTEMYLLDLVGVADCTCQICGLEWVQEYGLVPAGAYIDDLSMERTEQCQ